MNTLLLVASFLVLQPADELRFRKLEKGQVEVTAVLPKDLAAKFPVGLVSVNAGEALLRLCLLDPKSKKPGPPMLGRYERRGNELVFRPRVALEAGRHYRAYFGPTDAASNVADYRPIRPTPGEPVRVVKVYPTAEVLPANVLKFYIYFSGPMLGGQDIFEQIQLLDDKGNVLESTWLLDEIWDETGQVLIIYIHPGRIKWGLVLREIFGPVLYEHRQYSLVIRGEMLALGGDKIGKDYIKKFSTTPEDRVRVELSDWKLQAPKPGGRAPLVAQLPKSIDHKSLERFLSVIDAKGQKVAGASVVGKDEKSWSFAPNDAWQNAEYRLTVNGRMEDVAGNTPTRPFDLDLTSKQPPPQSLELRFHP